MDQTPLIAVFVDFENLALGRPGGRSADTDFDMTLVLNRLLEKGRIVYKRAYCDWSRFRASTKKMHEAGVELVDIPKTKTSGKNSADIRMVVDAIDLCYAKQHIDMFALVTGDSDFSPLAAKLKENDKRVLGCGVKNSTSPLLVSSCDEFIIYDDLVQKKKTRTKSASKTGGGSDAVSQVVEIVQSLEGDYDVLWGSMIKQALRRVHPGFSETASGYGNFNDVLEAAEDAGHLVLDFDEKRGNYQVQLSSRRKRS